MSSPRRTPRGTPSKQVTSPTPSGQSDSSRPQDMDVSEMSELAAPLPSSPAIPPSRGSELDLPRGGPGSVMISEIDLSSPLNYGTPGSVGSSIKTPRTGVRGTPIRIRSDIQSDKRLRTVNLSQPEGDAVPSSAGDGLPQSEVVPPSEASETAPTMVIWGTDVSVVPCKAKFKKFVETWVDPEPDVDKMISVMDKNAPTYMQRLEEIATLENPFLDVNCGHIQNFDADLYRQLICYPQEVIPTLDMAVNEMFFERFPDTTLTHQIQVRPYSADKTKNMRTLGPEDIDQLITITGMVTRASDLIPEMAEAVFRCSVCRYTVTAELERGRIHEPRLCQHCSTNHSFSLVHNRSRVTGLDKEKIPDNDGTHSPHLTETDQDTEDEFSNQDEELGKEHIERKRTKRKRKKLKPTSDRKSGAQWRKITLLVDTDDSSAEEEEWTKKQNCRNPKTQEVFRRKINAQQSKLDDLPQMTECSCDTDIEVAGLKDEFPTKVKRKNCDLVIKTDFGNHVPPTKKMFTEASEHMKTEHSNVSAIPNNDRIIRPRLEMEATTKKEKIEEADIIIMPGLFLPSKNDEQFAAITQKVISDTFNGLTLKEDCKFFICGSFRGLLLANHLGDTIDEKHMKNIEVIDPYVYAGIRLYDCENAGDPVFYPNREKNFTVINSQEVNEDDKEKIRSLKIKDDAREYPAIEREALGHALQEHFQSQKSIALVGRFPTSDEKEYYGIADFPVILPADPNSGLKSEIKVAVKKLADQLAAVQPEENESDMSE